MNTFKYVLSFIFLSLSINAASADSYISENIYTYIHSGPGQNYRIIGTVNAGAAIETLKSDDEAKYTEIKTQAGKIGWISTSSLQKALPAITLLPRVQEKLQNAQTKLQNIDKEHALILSEKNQSISGKDRQIRELQNTNKVLEANIKDLEELNSEFNTLLDTKDQRIRMEWLINGGGVLVCGLVLGLLLPFIPRRRKQRRDNW